LFVWSGLSITFGEHQNIPVEQKTGSSTGDYTSGICLLTYYSVVQTLPTPRGVPRHALTKYGLGGVFLFALLFIIWFPLLLFSMSSSIYTPAAPVSVKVRIKIGGYEVRLLTVIY